LPMSPKNESALPMSLENESQLQSAQESVAVAIQRKAGPAQQQSAQEKLVTPDPKAEIRTFSRQGRKEVPVALKEKPEQEKPIQEKAKREERRPQSLSGLQGLATLCSGLTTNSVSAGAVSPT
jgi:hypothetical protein